MTMTLPAGEVLMGGRQPSLCPSPLGLELRCIGWMGRRAGCGFTSIGSFLEEVGQGDITLDFLDVSYMMRSAA